jgi:hypothetical protein
MPRVTKVGNAQIALAVCLVVVAAAGIWWLNMDSAADDLADSSRQRWFVCTETGKPFKVTLERGMQLPVVSPHSGKPTGVEAELCYWTKDGQPAQKPTPVLMNQLVGKAEPTFCPDCGRLVVGHNPRPAAGRKPPPTQSEYAARRGAKSSRADAAAR